jgi:hypothetical protein
MFLSAMVHIPETLHRFHWPDGFAGRSGEVDLYATDPKLRLMFRAVVDQLRPDGTYLPLSDTRVGTPVNQQIAEIGQKRYPEYYRAAMPTVFRERKPSEYSLFHLDADEPATDEPAVLPEICFPAWKTAILRHGTGAEASVLALAFNGPGGHRQRDVLSLYYADRGRTVLGDHGYVGDMPINTWIRSSLSHNLVVVDDGEQRPAGHDRRRTRFRSMFTSPRVSWAEASAEVYDACREYRRSVALIKGQDAQTIAVDIFRVTGGKKHAFRVFSDLAASDADDGTLAFDGLSMPPESPLPTFGASLAREHIFGLRDPRTVSDPPAAWRATWKQKDRRYRMWMASPASDITASNGPGQQTRTDAGRRVRYVDVIRKGENDLTSTFVAVHEPSGVDGTPPVQRVRRLDLPATAGDDAVAIEIASRWGTYLLLSEFTEETEVAGVRFAGTFGLLCRTTGDRRWLATSGARTLRDGDFGFANATASWSGGITEHTSAELVTDTPRPDDWPSPVERVTAYVRVESDQDATGFAVRSTATHRIAVERFPLPAVTRFHLPRVRVLAE